MRSHEWTLMNTCFTRWFSSLLVTLHVVSYNLRFWSNSVFVDKFNAIASGHQTTYWYANDTASSFLEQDISLWVLVQSNHLKGVQFSQSAESCCPYNLYATALWHDSNAISYFTVIMFCIAKSTIVYRHTHIATHSVE